MENYMDELKTLIKEALDGCEDTLIYPSICRLKQDPSGYAKIEDFVISLIKNEGFGIQSALAQVESTF